MAKRFIQKAKRQRALLLMVLPGVVLLVMFNYLPMYGVILAFKDYSVRRGIWGSEWVGLKWFEMFFVKNQMAGKLLKNTFLLGFYSLLWSFPAPIVLALLFNEIFLPRFKKAAQTISYFPYFISTVIVCGLVKEFCARTGLINQLTSVFGIEPVSFLLSPKYFRTIFIASGIWQTVGFSCIIYLAALSGVDMSIWDAALIDGANRFQRILHINWPAIAPTTSILLLFAISGIMGNDFTKIMLLYSPQIYATADVIGTYTYREGIQNSNFAYGTAIGLFNSLIGFALIVLSNWGSRRLSQTSLW